MCDTHAYELPFLYYNNSGMAHVNEPSEGEATSWDEIINNKDYDKFFQLTGSDNINVGELSFVEPTQCPRIINILYMCTRYAMGTGRKWFHGYLTRKCKLTPIDMRSRR